ncbi:MAG: Gfo/Idh/MocA family oxidoreductase [Elusimicrobiota bacterium]|jgi:predicted dehydrogenase|nr:Gfo/Idh/MocA family oxidoreductase [Elusimicrobiota bacterium]
MKEIRVGVLGTGFMGKTHIFGYRSIPVYYEPDYKIKLTGVFSKTFANAQKAKELYDFEFATDNEDDIFARKDIDIINICTPDAFHRGQILKALDAGKNIYCEKPLISAVQSSAEILNHPNLKKVTTQTVFHNRFFASVLRAKQIIEEGRLGKILAFRGQFLLASNAKSALQAGWRNDSEKSGGNGALYDIGSHICDMIYYLLGGFSKIYCKTMTPYKQRPDGKGGAVPYTIDDGAAMIATLENGAVGTVEATKLATGAATNMMLEINGEDGALIIDLTQPNWLYFYDNALPDAKLGGYKGYTRIECIQNYDTPVMFPPGKHPVGWIRAHIHSLYNFVESVNTGAQTNPSLADGLYIQSVLDRALKSSKENREIEI